VIAALGQVRSGIAEKLAPLIDAPAPAMDGLVTALINELPVRAAEGEVLLILDDYHVVDSLSVHASLAFLIEHLPPSLHLVLTSRADPPLSLARLRPARKVGRPACNWRRCLYQDRPTSRSSSRRSAAATATSWII
jgi:LuxR family maltose regulon positive regulatory protein